ncbi:MAG: YfhO family protein [Acidobacteria bacterium]|nr:YfhO family protein [Acidobacteriota bacterium]
MQIVGSLGALWRRRRGDAAALAVIAAFFTLMFAQEIFGGKYVLAGDYLFLDAPHAEQLYVLAPFLLSPIFTYAYARETGRSRTAALLAGLAFGYGGMMCSALSFNGALTNSLMWLPLLLIPLDRAARRAGRFVPLLVAATAAYAMSVLNGHGQSMLYTGLLAAAYGLYLSLFPPGGVGTPEETGDTGAHRPPRLLAGFDGSRWRPLCVALFALVMSAGIGAFQILETMRAARRSVRSVLTYEAFSTGSFSLTSVFGSVVAPLYHFTDVTAYMPPLALLLAALTCAAALRRRETTDARIYFWLGVAVVAWLLMLGGNTPLHHVVYRTPLLNKFRVPSRHTFEWTFALAVLAAYGWDALDARLGETRHLLRGRRFAIELFVIVSLIATGVAVGFYWWTATQAKPQIGTIWYTSLPESAYLLWKAAFTACTFLLIWRSWRLGGGRLRQGFLMAGIALACFVEPAIGFSRWIGELLLTAERFSVVSPTTRFLQNYPPEQNRVYTRVQLYTEEFTLAPRIDSTNLSALSGIQNVAGYEPLILDRYSRALGGVGMDGVTPRAGYARNNDLFQPRSRVLDLLNTRHVVSFSSLGTVEEPLVYREGIAFSPSDMLSTLPPGGAVTLAGGAGESDTLAVVTSLSNSITVRQGTPVARVRFYLSGATFVERDIRAGIETAEWAHERPDVRPIIQHTLAPIFEAHPGDESDSFKAHRYLAILPLGARGRVEKIEITSLTQGAPLAVWKATLYDSAGKSATPLSPAASEGWRTVYLKDNTLILENRRALPRAWLVTAAEAVDGEEALRRIRGESAHEFDPRRTALLEVAPAELPALTGGELGDGSGARITTYEPNRLVIETQAGEPTVLVLSENTYPGWEATVDGKAARIETADYLLRAVALPAGAHRVEMRYTAPAARNGAIISALTLLALCGLTIYDRRARRTQVTQGH